MNGEDIDYRKIFCIGFNKTGTTSLHALFESLGFEAMDGPHWRKKEHWYVHYQFQTFTDGPPFDFSELDDQYPNSLFILNVRNLDEWLDSRVEHIRFRIASGTFKSKGQWKISEQAICQWIRARQSHHLKVLQYFQSKPDALLVINYIKHPHAADIICRFIGKPMLAAKPYVRSTPSLRAANKVKNQDLLNNCYNKLGLKADEISNDLLCPSLLPPDFIGKYPLDTIDLNYNQYL